MAICKGTDQEVVTKLGLTHTCAHIRAHGNQGRQGRHEFKMYPLAV